MKKPDRFERMVPGWEQMDPDDMRACLVPATTMVKALRRQYRQIRMVVKTALIDPDGGKEQHRGDILAALEQWRRG